MRSPQQREQDMEAALSLARLLGRRAARRATSAFRLRSAEAMYTRLAKAIHGLSGAASVLDRELETRRREARERKTRKVARQTLGVLRRAANKENPK